MEYITVKNAASDFFIEKKSKFIGSCRPVQTEEEALAFVAGLKKQHFDASHNVYAYILREGNLRRFSDDGEPQGKAGIPVLDAMEKSGVTDAVVVATRYFGGTLLGGGGLIRAYSHTASIALAAAERIVMKSCLLMELRCDYNHYGRVSALIPDCGGVIDDTEFLEDVTLRFHIVPEEQAAMQKKLSDLTNGSVEAEAAGEKFFEFSAE